MAEHGIRLFASDLDGTLLGNPEATLRFKHSWENIPREERPLLVYNSGRPLKDIDDVCKEGILPEADYHIGGVGTQILDVKQNLPLEAFNKVFHKGWDLEVIEHVVANFPGVEAQPPEFLHPYKSSWYLDRAEPKDIDKLRTLLEEAGQEVQVVYSSLKHLDVVPKTANKGNALHWLCDHLKVDLGNVIVTGDTANDSSMFDLDGVKGIVVENAQPELLEAVVDHPVYLAGTIFADGVLEGLANYNVLDRQPLVSEPAGMSVFDPGVRQMIQQEYFGTLTQQELDLVITGYQKAIIALKKCITPVGFAACSLEDNEVTGTDENYRSVWARDGAITVICSMDLEDADLRKCQEATLRTLLDHLTPNGQIPSNVRIDSMEPDYSGVGGICSIDSGLWVIIAAYHFVNKTGNLDFYYEYEGQLQQAMNWLSAHDSNNDALLEVPEAGDWTDLFGRSYNVLYDEVLWFRANVCYGRLLELAGQHDRAADYLRWSQMIRGKILHTFWPSTNVQDNEVTMTFADRQTSIGDAHYLLAEISPFSFNWRCDVYANVLAFLTNLLDADRARKAFRFMAGVGVNQPYPVANLYPAVQAGDPDWKPYYTVNLLNLPYHYHNGGIWPLCGGMWVRFVHRLGMRDVASRELVRLTELVRLGSHSEWEFNEWAHGQTGLPMGKRFQAWSAGSYIRACQELRMNDPESFSHSE